MRTSMRSNQNIQNPKCSGSPKILNGESKSKPFLNMAVEPDDRFVRTVVLQNPVQRYNGSPVIDPVSL